MPILALHPPVYDTKQQAQHTIDEHALTMFDHSQGAAILSPTPRALSFPTHPMLDYSLDGPTPRAFTFPSTVHESLSNGNRGPPLTPPEPSPSTPSTSSSPFEPERPQNASKNLQQQTTQTQFTAPPIARRSQSVQRARTDTASPAAQISSFNAPDGNPGAPLTLAARRRGSSISSLAIPTLSHTLNFGQSVSQPAASQTQNMPPPLPPNPHAHGITLAGTERRPKRGDEDYIKRPENAFILFRRECCLRKNEAEAAAAQEGDPVIRRQRQADLSKTISQQWRSLSAEERKYWDDLAKQRKKEHEEMYPWYVYQPTRSEKKKKKSGEESTGGGKAKREKEGKKERRERTKSSSRVRGTGARARNSSACSTNSTASTTSMSSSASTVDSDDFSELDSLSADGSLYAAYRYANGSCGSVPEVEVADLADFDMSEADNAQKQGQVQSLSLPLSLSMSSLPGQHGSGSGASLAIDTRNALASFSLESGPISTSSYSHSHHGGHGHGHGHSLSAQISTQTAQNIASGPLSFVLPQGRRSTSAPGAPTPPADLYPPAPPTIKLPQLLETNTTSNNSSTTGSPVIESATGSNEQQAQVNGQVSAQQRETEYNAMSSFQFPGPHAQLQQQQQQSLNFGMPGQVPNFSSAGGEIQNSMFHIYEEPPTARPRPRALSQITIPNEPPTNTGPLSAPAPTDSSASSTARLFLPHQMSTSTPADQSSSSHLLQVPRAIPQGLPESPEPPAGGEWDDFDLPAWAMSTFSDADEAALHHHHQQQEQHHSLQLDQQQHQGQNQSQEAQPQNVFGEIDISMDMGLPPWLGFGGMDSMSSMNSMSPMTSMGSMSGMSGMGVGVGVGGGMGCGMDGMTTDGHGASEHERVVDPYAMQFQYEYEDLLDPSSQL